MSDRSRKFVPRRPERLILPGWAVALIAIAIIGLLIGTILILANLLQPGPADSAPLDQQQTVQAPPQPASIAGYQPWRGSERVTMLLMGIDERQSESGPWRTDTIIILTIDPITHTGAMLSIPRDLWVQIPDVGQDRINTANFHGDAKRYPGGGPALVMATIEQNLGIPIDNYMLLNFAAFTGFIDVIGCISLDVPVDIADTNYPAAEGFGYEPFYLNAGHHEKVCGQQALKYARTRATFGSDFDRASRQQQVIYAVRQQLLTPEHLPTLLASLPEIWATVQDGVSSDLTLDQMVGLGLLAINIEEGNIRSEVLDGRYVTATTIVTDQLPQSVLLPKNDAIRLLAREMFSDQSTIVSAELLQQVANEAATVSVLNGTASDGLAELASQFLSSKGLSVQDTGLAGRRDYQQTIIYDNSGKTGTADYLAALLGLPESAIIQTHDPQARYDIQVILGGDAFP